MEVTGRDEWFDRMRGIEEDLWKLAKYDTPYGKIPSTNVEVNGEQIQALVRLYTMTGETRFLAWAERLADYYLADPDWLPAKLRDHGCEIIGGLGLLLGVESERNPEKAKAYQERLRMMFDAVLARGVNEDGIMYDKLDQTEGRLSDGWGYNYVAYLCYDQAAGQPVVPGWRGANAPESCQAGLCGLSLGRPVHRRVRRLHRGAMYLINRLPVPEAIAWVDREMAANVARSGDPLDTAELWGTMKLESNGVRTVLMHALMHTRGLIARPWRRDLALGACETADGLAIVMKADEDWSGRIVFDIPRHRLYMGFQRDWPRMNTLPEWFTVEPEENYAVTDVSAGSGVIHTGGQLREGLEVTLTGGEEKRLLVTDGNRL